MTDHECPRAFYCLPESCGDCPHDEQPSCVACGRGQAGDKHTCQKDELPCEGCPDPGMPCLGCPALDEQDGDGIEIPEVTHESVAIQYGKDAAANAFTLGRNKGYAEGERAATERIYRRIEKVRDKYLAADDMTAYEVCDDLLKSYREGRA